MGTVTTSQDWLALARVRARTLARNHEQLVRSAPGLLGVESVPSLLITLWDALGTPSREACRDALRLLAHPQVLAACDARLLCQTTTCVRTALWHLERSA